MRDLSASIEVREEEGRSKGRREKTSFFFTILVPSVVEISLITYYVFIKNSSFSQLEKSPSGFERTK